jgi:hypothetical protein
MIVVRRLNSACSLSIDSSLVFDFDLDLNILKLRLP